MEIGFCMSRVIHGVFINFDFCLEILLEGHTYLRFERSWSEN